MAIKVVTRWITDGYICYIDILISIIGHWVWCTCGHACYLDLHLNSVLEMGLREKQKQAKCI